MNVLKTDVLIIGGGGAGSRAAIEADSLGAETIILCKGRYGLPVALLTQPQSGWLTASLWV
ncbi:FAD-binding protein [Candidatus Bathyarchaeota archaeon]|nr:MAG: FAD-binding protein [Candidatus Bathyarchaeota archaeon]